MIEGLTNWATWREIHSQPEIWRSWGATLDVAGLRGWISDQVFDEVWFCGAGTSAYIGDIVAASVKGTRSVPSTDLVADPAHVLAGARPLVVSFGRSGNSAESIGTMDALDALVPDAPRLNITCNKDGALATRVSTGPAQVIILPDATHDAGFAMTSSFSTMLLTALALFDVKCDVPARLNALADQLDNLLPQLIAGDRPGRAVYVGAGPLTFAAREAALKVMELSAGQMPALWDSTLGFRHGPKAFVTDSTAITIFLNPNQPTQNYGTDLAKELQQQFPRSTVQTIGPGGDIDVAMPFGAAWAAPLCVAQAQVKGVMWAHSLGLNVDDPFSGQSTLSRVVSDVKLYPVTT
ncbi:SIS domain-containing protein [Octadecabacter ascidiaceicola]|uniref:Putative tagatose-6-phosphate ketose/aldose isomerase n=1 Tax=Octadecabacter ascidiaceicola TaxID=1655543 RepID=A0A238KQ30_9RHOB|nr:tagatose-bisphosphate aldolase [Octadecabacter ascidiaceicola]SMX44767.1 Putative tagatose-6-phosphate ketose/aldose isomerase [Octadecabacter ascidiaceicola]